MLEFSSSINNKDLENTELRPYLENKGFNQLINYLYKPTLIETYKELIHNTKDIVERGFIEMMNVHNELSKKSELTEAYLDFEQNMDDESYKNFLKVKNETLKD